MDFKMVKKDAFKVIGLKYRGKNENNEIPALWPKLSARGNEFKDLGAEPFLAYGICMNFDMESKIFDYIAGIGVKTGEGKADDMVEIDIPTQEYAVFECTLPTLMKTIGNIYEKWLPGSEYKRIKDAPEFELYNHQFDPNNPESKMFLYIPVEKG